MQIWAWLKRLFCGNSRQHPGTASDSEGTASSPPAPPMSGGYAPTHLGDSPWAGGEPFWPYRPDEPWKPHGPFGPF
jgi:hypothetical protein